MAKNNEACFFFVFCCVHEGIRRLVKHTLILGKFSSIDNVANATRTYIRVLQPHILLDSQALRGKGKPSVGLKE